MYMAWNFRGKKKTEASLRKSCVNRKKTKAISNDKFVHSGDLQIEAVDI